MEHWNTKKNHPGWSMNCLVGLFDPRLSNLSTAHCFQRAFQFMAMAARKLDLCPTSLQSWVQRGQVLPERWGALYQDRLSLSPSVFLSAAGFLSSAVLVLCLWWLLPSSPPLPPPPPPPHCVCAGMQVLPAQTTCGPLRHSLLGDPRHWQPWLPAPFLLSLFVGSLFL